MANIAEVDEFTPVVYELSTTDPVEGGPGGIANAQAQALANRTLYLKNYIDALMLPITSGKGWLLFNDIVANIPAGWAEVEEMRGRAPIGHLSSDAAFDTVGEVGGAKTKTIGIANLPAHNFLIANSGFANGEPVVTSSTTVAHKSVNTPGGSDNYDILMAGVDGPANVGKTNTIGSGTALDVLNPYRVVTYIKWVGL